jgi:hypothetical protein
VVILRKMKSLAGSGEGSLASIGRTKSRRTLRVSDLAKRSTAVAAAVILVVATADDAVSARGSGGRVSPWRISYGESGPADFEAVVAFSPYRALASSGSQPGIAPPVGQIVVWNGFEWKQWAHSPTVNGGLSIERMAGRSMSSVWIIARNARGVTSIRRWNGQSWTRITSRGLLPADHVSSPGTLLVTKRTVWLIGERSAATKSARVASYRPGAKHPRWRGYRLTRHAELTAATARTGNDVWAVGTIGREAASDEPLVEHFNGKGWSRVTTPQLPGGSLVGVAADRPDDVMTVGVQAPAVPGSASPVALHLAGTSWAQTQLPSSFDLSAITAGHGGSYWLGGIAPKESYAYWDGARWPPAAGTDFGTGCGDNAQVRALARVPSGGYFAVGTDTAQLCSDPTTQIVHQFVDRHRRTP